MVPAVVVLSTCSIAAAFEVWHCVPAGFNVAFSTLVLSLTGCSKCYMPGEVGSLGWVGGLRGEVLHTGRIGWKDLVPLCTSRLLTTALMGLTVY